MYKAFKFRIYPNAGQIRQLEGQLSEACRLYNAALAERKSAWEMRRARVNMPMQGAQLKDIRASGDIGIQNYNIACEVLHRVDDAFRAFFRRAKAGERPGYPRFRSVSRYDTIGTLHYGDGMGLKPGGVRVSGVAGLIKAKQHRPIEGTPKVIRVTRHGSWWHVTIFARCEAGPLPPSDTSVGIDVGLSSFVAFSDGRAVAAPKYLRASESKLRRAQRHLARCRRDSRRRLKAKAAVASLYRRVAARRLDFTHKLSRSIVNEHGRIAVEKLNIKGMVRGHFAKSIHDAGWRLFLNQTAYKAESAGRVFVEVDARGTSQTCICGEHVPKRLKDRWHDCPSCGLSAPRDVVSAQVIEQRGRRWQALTGPIGAVVCDVAPRRTSLTRREYPVTP